MTTGPEEKAATPAAGVDAAEQKIIDREMEGGSFARNWIILAVFFLIICVMIMAMMQGPDGEEGDTIRIGRGNDVKSLDPANISDIESGQVCYQIYEGLVKFPEGPDALSRQPEPCLAERFEPAEDGLSWTFHLRPGVWFHDKTGLDAVTVKMSLDRLTGLDGGKYAGSAANFPYRAEYANIRRIEQVDMMTIRIHLQQPSSVILRQLAMTPASIISPESLRKLEADPTSEFVAAGSGPYMLMKPDQNWKRGESLTLQRFRAYWGEPHKPEALVFRVIGENNQRVTALQSGDVDIISDPPRAQVAGLKDGGQFAVIEETAPNVCYLSMCPNATLPDRNSEGGTVPNPLAPAWLREAIALAIDRGPIIETNYRGLAEAAHSIIPPGVLGHPSPGEPAGTADKQARARELVHANAPDGITIPLHCFTQPRAYLPDPPGVSREIVRQLSEVGITVELKPEPWESYLPAALEGAFPFLIIGWQTDNGDPDNFLSPLFGLQADGTPHPINTSKWTSPEFAGLLASARRETDSGARARLYQQASGMLRAAHICVPLVHSRIIWVTRKDLHGFMVHPMGDIIFRQTMIGDPAAGNDAE